MIEEKIQETIINEKTKFVRGKKMWQFIFIILLMISAGLYSADNNYNTLLEENARLENERLLYKDIADNSINNFVKLDVSYEDYVLLSKLVEAEAGNQSYRTRLFVASVVVNRVAAEEFPSTISDVIFEEGQFEVTERMILGKLMIDCVPSESSYRAAWEVMHNGSVLPSRVLVFFGNECTEPWVNSRPNYCISDCMSFSYLQ